MRVSEILSYALLQATVIAATPHDARNKKVTPSKRPNHAVGPHHLSKPLPVSPDRTKTCIVQAHGNGTDDSANILESIKDCNNGGHVVFPKDQKFTIGTALDLTFLNHIDLGKAPMASNISPACH
jgi:galacturan 1,4-alpha-galacturonidase